MPSFLTIQEQVQLLLIDTPASVQSMIPVFINDGLKAIQEDHNFMVMQDGLDIVTTPGGYSPTALPANWKEVRGKPYITSYYGVTTQLEWASSTSNAKWVYEGTRIGQPQIIVEHADTLSVYPITNTYSGYPDGFYRLTVPYWGYIDPLVDDTDENWFTSNAELFLRYYAVQMGFAMNEDEGRSQYWAAFAQDGHRRAVRTDKRRVVAGLDTFVPQSGALGPKVIR